MLKPTIVPDFMTISDAALITRSCKVLTGMSGKAYFKTPVVAMKDLSKQIDLFTPAVAEAQNRDRKMAAAKNAIKTDLRAMLAKLKLYVEDIAQDHEVTLLSSGFKIKGSTAQPAEPGVFNNFKVKPGLRSGEIILSCSKVLGSVSYGFQFAIDGAAPV